MPGMFSHTAHLLAQAPAQTASAWPVFVILFVVFVLPFILGSLIARAIRLQDLGFSIGLVLCAIFFGLAPFAYQGLMGRSPLSAIHLGIDLAGGTNLVYRIDQAQAKADGKTVDKATIEKMVQAIQKRINPSGAEEMTVRGVGDDRIEVIIPGADRDLVNQKKNAIKRVGSLEFAILANDKDHRDLIAAGRALADSVNVVMRDKQKVAGWCDVAPGKDVGQNGDDRTVVREVKRTGPDGKETTVRQFLVKFEPPDRAVTGKYLVRASEQIDQNGQPVVGFTLNSAGGSRFLRLTTANAPDTTDQFFRRLAILLDGQVHSAPRLNDRISSSGQISGQFTKAEIDELINVLNAGALEVPLIPEPVSEFTISPLLGADVQRKGLNAIYVSALAIVVFMIAYYMLAGVIADLSLLLNLVLLVGSMALIEATFTLPGLAGLVLTIGMAVDANVLIYERMREELARGASLRMAIENGFDKALAAIVDSNVTTLITAAVLYFIGTDQIRGFAVSLFIGLTMSLFSALYFGRLMFTIIERKRVARTLKMRQFIGETKFDFLKYRGTAVAASLIVIGLGLATMFARGSSNFDIDFTGGTMVTFEFVEPQKTDVVREKLVEKFGTTLSLEQLALSGDTNQSFEGGTRFRVRATEPDQNKVRTLVNEAFTSPELALRRVTMDFTELAPITDAEAIGDDARFKGGQKSTLTFSGSILEATVAEYLAAELGTLKNEKGTARYDAPLLLLDVRGQGAAEGATPPAAEGATVANAPAAAGTTVAPTAATDRFTSVVVRALPDLPAVELAEALKAVQARMASEPVFDEVNSFDTSVAFGIQRDAIVAVVLSLIAIVIYLWFRFEKLYYGLAAVVAVAHDVLVTLGAIAVGAYLSRTPIGPVLLLEDFKINMGLIASLLTIVGYSLNDTIVIFDRIREIKGKNPNITYDMINLSVNQTLSRTILTATTVLIVVLILYIFGGAGIHGFAYSLIIGTITGCYSTVYIANPVLYWLIQREQTTSGPAAKSAA